MQYPLWMVWLLSLTILMLPFTAAAPANAMANTWPVNEQQVIDQFGVQHDPADKAFQVVRETQNGYEVHCSGCDISSLGSQMLPVCVDYNPLNGMVGGSYSVFQQVSDSWIRLQLQPGQAMTWWGYQVSMYGGWCSPVGSNPVSSAPAPQPAPAPAPQASCPTDASQLPGLVGGRNWQPIPGSDGRGWVMHSDDSVSVHSQNGIEVLTPSFPQQPGLPNGQSESVNDASAWCVIGL